uniref:Uncharacterized protein n=1 Tax=Arundo donax TaxID=35708 RepID=A0A0A8YYN6_ARUDO
MLVRKYTCDFLIIHTWYSCVGPTNQAR